MDDDQPTVLVVDDEEAVVEVYALALREGYDVREAHGGREALEAVDGSVDVVLLDRRMPGLSGKDVLDEIRERGLDVRVAMVTAVDPDFDVVEMAFDAYLTKPVTDEEIREVVDELLALDEHDDRLRELYAITEKRAALEVEKTDRELADSEAYDALRERETELDAEAAAAMEEVDDETFGRLVSDLTGDEADER